MLNEIRKRFERYLISYMSRDEITFFAHEHGLTGFLYQDSMAFKQQYLKNTILRAELDRLASRENLKDEMVILKGIGLLELGIYNLGERSISDVDLLVSDLQKVSRWLEDLGYKEVFANKWKANNFKRVYSKSVADHEIVFELHTKLFYHVDFSQFKLERTTNNYLILGKEDFLVHLVGHLAFQHTFLKFHWLLDIAIFWNNFNNELDMERVRYLLEKLKLKRSWFWCFYFYEMIFKKENLLFKLLLKKFIFFPEKCLLRYYLIKHLTKDSLREALRYDLTWFFNRGWKINER